MTGPVHEVDLEAFASNLQAIGRRVAPAHVMLVVKDDAYRHGLRDIVPRALREGVDWFGAFDVRTAEQVRSLAAQDPGKERVFVWSIGGADDASRAVRGGMDVGIGDAAQLDLIAAASLKIGTPARVHLKIDSGLRRNGFRPEDWDDAVRAAREWEQRGALRVEGLWSHIAEASDEEDDGARSVFEDAVAAARAGGLTPRLRHLAASAASFARPEFRYDMVRVGAFAYGIRPAGGPAESELGITPVLTLSATVTAVAADRVNVSIGALDGLPSALAGRASVDTANGPRRFLRIGPYESEVEAWPGAVAGQRVTVYGPAARSGRSATDLAELVGTIGEEVVLRTGKDDGIPR